ncbi:hypothetical protein, partial [Cellulomonas biazotea]|uniref:hypothetical protein n=1 Tax=Cellulomonas biazotea TaxID=1709 RepID=UPI0035E8D686
MRAKQKKFNKTYLLDKLRINKKQIGLVTLIALLVGTIIDREFMFQLGVLFLALSIIGYVLFKAGLFAFTITFSFIKGTLTFI